MRAALLHKLTAALRGVPLTHARSQDDEEPYQCSPAPPATAMKEQLLIGKTILLTGAGGLIGKGIAHALAQHGANIYCCDIDKQTQEELVDDLRKYQVRAECFITDVSQPSQVDLLCAALTKLTPEVDVLIHAAGIRTLRSPFPNQNAAAWTSTLQTNLVGALYLTKRMCERMIQRAVPGSIIFITSIHQSTVWGEVGYSASKAALGAAIKELALDLAAHGIRVNGIAPGAVGEDAQGKPLPHPPTPLQHTMVMPSSIGRAAVFLASEYFSPSITGTVITVDGGLSLHSYLSAMEQSAQ